MTYRERRLARAEKLRDWSQSNEAKSDARYAAVNQIADGIPFGQPILVGHHSERRHRRDIAKMQAGMSASVELDDKAKRQAAAADGIEAQAAGAIYDDDPDAIEALGAKIAKLEARREAMKAANADYRKANRAELKEMSPYQRGQAVPYPSYALSNLGGNISRCRERLARLQREKVSGPRDRLISARFASDCADCGARLEKGDSIRYNRAQGARCAPGCEG
jgi:hypothetical protein